MRLNVILDELIMAGLIITLLANVCALHVFSVMNYNTVCEARQNRSKALQAVAILQREEPAEDAICASLTNRIPRRLFSWFLLLDARVMDNIRPRRITANNCRCRTRREKKGMLFLNLLKQKSKKKNTTVSNGVLWALLPEWCHIPWWMC